MLLEHQQTMEKVAHHQQHQQLLQQQLHRAHLELGAAHQRITKNDEVTALLEIKLEDSEFKRGEAKRKHEVEMVYTTKLTSLITFFKRWWISHCLLCFSQL